MAGELLKFGISFFSKKDRGRRLNKNCKIAVINKKLKNKLISLT